nr:MAG TPA: HORMA domain protein [Bacteriophage sp.]
MQESAKHMNSKYDYLYMRDNFPEEVWRPYWQSILDESKVWIDIGEIDAADGVTDATHRIETFTLNDNGEEKSSTHQYELRTDPSSDMIRLGFTEEEVRQALLQDNKKASKSL